MKNNDDINHPSHYTNGSIEVIEYIDDNLGENFEPYYVGNILKYISRYKLKHGIQDLKKAAWYLDRLIGKMDSPERKEKIGEAYAEGVGKYLEPSCYYTPSKLCYSKRCKIDSLYRKECRDNYFMHRKESTFYKNECKDDDQWI